MKPVQISGLFNAESFKKLKAHVDGISEAMKDRPLTDTIFNRHHVHNEQFLTAVHRTLIGFMSNIAGETVTPSYSFLSIYRQGGICPLHTDRKQCKYTIDLCISQSKPWPIYIDGQAYTLQENEAVIYSGTGSPHYRDRIEDGQHCTLAFFHFVPSGYIGPTD